MQKLAVLSVMPILLLAACGTEQSGSADVTVDLESPQGVQAAIAANHERWSGTIDDRQAAQVLREHLQNGAYTECMQAKGYDEFDWRDGVEVAEFPDSGLIGLLEPYGQEQLQHEALIAARAAAYDYNANHPEEYYEVWNDDVISATDECLAETKSVSDDELESVLTPDGYEDLAGAWYGDEKTFQIQLYDLESPETKSYAECMENRGFGDGEIHHDDESAPTLMSRLRRQVPTPQHDAWQVINDPAKRESSPEWKSLVDAEHAWLDADQACRADLVAEHIGAVKAHQDAFMDKHADEIREVEKGWAEIRDDAAELGWAPDRPFAK